jgi:HTH-type transcriptional repressor of NAD biosynthesis genes
VDSTVENNSVLGSVPDRVGGANSKFGQAVVIGKFYPPHHGHKLLIETALAQSRQVTVIVCAKQCDRIPGDLRGRWLAEIHPRAKLIVIDDRYDENDTAVWAANTVRWLGGAPDVVFTSEAYGEPYARMMGCGHVLVDPNRHQVRCSGTTIRRDPWACWDFLDPPVRAWFVRRVCVLGAESTGTTTLAQMLAEQYCTVWVPEYGREYSATKQLRGDTGWTSDEFIEIAAEQNRREELAARQANHVQFGDTNAFATRFWHRRYMGFESEAVGAEAERACCHLYLLTGDEIPFVQDGLRDGEHIRHVMHGWFEEGLRLQSVPWQLVRGSPSERLAQASAAVDALFSGSAWLSQIRAQRKS